MLSIYLPSSALLYSAVSHSRLNKDWTAIICVPSLFPPASFLAIHILSHPNPIFPTPPARPLP